MALHRFQAFHHRLQQVLSVRHIVAVCRQVVDDLTLARNARMALYDVAIGISPILAAALGCYASVRAPCCVFPV
jgi:hypothetical protein